MPLLPLAYSTVADTVYVFPAVHDIVVGPFPEVDPPGPILKPVPEYRTVLPSVTLRAVIGTFPVFFTLKFSKHVDILLEHTNEDDSATEGKFWALLKYPSNTMNTTPAMVIVTAMRMSIPMISPMPLVSTRIKPDRNTCF